MKRLSFACVTIALLSVACGSSSSSPTSSTPLATRPTLTATLLPANEVPPVSGPEATGTGNVVITWDTTTDSNGNITSAKVNFSVNLFGFPSTVTAIAAHIHQGPPTCACPFVVNTTLTTSDQVKSDTLGAISFVKTGIAVADPALAQQIINNPSGFYFNIHSTANPGGFARGQLTRVQ